MKTQKQGHSLKVMAKKKSVKIDILQGENENTLIFVLSQDIRGLSTYEKAKAINTFITRETNVLATCVENHLRQLLIKYNVVPSDGSESALKRSFSVLEYLHHKKIDIRNRYVETQETIVGENENNQMTVINEDDILSCAVEIEVINCG